MSNKTLIVCAGYINNDPACASCPHAGVHEIRPDCWNFCGEREERVCCYPEDCNEKCFSCKDLMREGNSQPCLTCDLETADNYTEKIDDGWSDKIFKGKLVNQPNGGDDENLK